MEFSLPDLPYPSTALEPHIDARTMEIHHGKHHQGYVTKLNAAIDGRSDVGSSIEELCTLVPNLPADVQSAVRNNGGGHFNHSLFWSVMAPAGSGGGGTPTGELAEAINESFGSFDAFKEKFANAAATRFGSGWAWLGVQGNGSLTVCSTPNQDNPLMGSLIECPCRPILGIDVWEHAYYLNYQNRRPDYVTAWWNVVNWSAVADRFATASTAATV